MSVVETLTGPAVGPLYQLPVAKVRPADDNVRGDLGDLDGLAASIVEHGLVQPIVVHASPEEDGTFVIVAGHRRHAAHVKAGLDTIEAIVRPRPADGDGDTTAVRLVENLHREDLTVADEARGYKRLNDPPYGWSQRRIAKAVGVNQSHVSKRIKLADLPDPVLDAITAGDCRVEDALDLVKLTDRDPAKAAELIARADWYGIRGSLDRAERDARRAEAMAKAQAAAETGGPPVVLELAETSLGSMYGNLRARGMQLADVTESSYGVDRDRLEADGTLGVVVDTDGQLREVCTDVARYTKAHTAADTPAREPHPYERWSDASEARRAFLDGALAAGDLTAPPAHMQLIRLLCDHLLGDATSDVVKTGALAADIDTSGSAAKIRERIRERVDVSRPSNTEVDTAVRVAHAMQLAMIDRRMSWYGTPGEVQRAHLADLQACGYELSDIEREWLARDDDQDDDPTREIAPL